MHVPFFSRLKSLLHKVCSNKEASEVHYNLKKQELFISMLKCFFCPTPVSMMLDSTQKVN